MEDEALLMAQMEGPGMHATMIAEITPEEAAEIEAAIMRAEEEERQRQEQVKQSLANQIEAKFTQVKANRAEIEARILESYEYALGSLAEHANRGSMFDERRRDTAPSPPKFNIIRPKIAIAVSQLFSNQFGTGPKNWDLAPSASAQSSYPYDPQADAQADIQSRMEGMESEIQDQLDYCNYVLECQKAMTDCVTIGTGILKGPMNSMRMVKHYVPEQTSDGKIVRIPHWSPEYKPSVKRVDPWYFFPDDSTNDISKAEFAIEAHPMSKKDLALLLRNPGFDHDLIRQCLEENPKEHVSSTGLNDPAFLTDGYKDWKNKYIVLEYHGPVTQDDLLTIGIEPKYDTLGDLFMAEVWVCNGRVIRISLENLEGYSELPYAVCAWEPDPGSIFGFGIPKLCKPQQDVVNKTYHAAMKNAGLSAGPIAIVNKQVVKPAVGGYDIEPFKVFYVDEAMSDTDIKRFIDFVDIPNKTEELFAVLNLAKQFADEESNIPLIMGGLQGPQPAETATGVTVANQNATSPLFFKSQQWDENVTKRTIEWMYHWNMQYNENDEIKGDFEVDVRTSTMYLQQQAETRELERLSLEGSQNPALGEWLNMDELTKARLARSKIPYRKIIKSEQEVMQAREEAAANQPPDPAMLEIELRKEEIELNRQRLGLDQQKIEFENSRGQQREMWEHEEKMAQVDVRRMEAEGSVVGKQLDFQAAMAKLAATQEQNAQQILAKVDIASQQEQTKKFIAGAQLPPKMAELELKANDQQLKREEAQIKRKQGTGY